MSNRWLTWLYGCAEVEPLMFPPASFPQLPNNILMRFTSQTRAGPLYTVIFWIFGSLEKKKKKKKANINQDQRIEPYKR